VTKKSEISLGGKTFLQFPKGVLDVSVDFAHLAPPK